MFFSQNFLLIAKEPSLYGLETVDSHLSGWRTGLYLMREKVLLCVLSHDLIRTACLISRPLISIANEQTRVFL
jgi:hypothetical protein